MDAARSPSSSGSPRSRGTFSALITLMGLAGLLSASGAPVAKSAAWLEGLGAPATATGAILHLAPVLAAPLVWAGMRFVSKRRGALTRGLLYGLLGGVYGFGLAFCLDLFVGVIPAIERLTGPLEEAGGVDIAAWSLTAFSLAMGLMMLLFATLGTPAVRAVAMPDTDPECMEVRARDKGVYALSALGLVGQGVFVGALTVANQMDVGALPVRIGVAGATLLGALAFCWSSWALWRGFDEMQRRATVEAYAWSGFIAWFACIAWAVMESLALAEPMSAFTATISLVALQTVAALAVATRMGGGAPVATLRVA
jgi:hypothetical protein